MPALTDEQKQARSTFLGGSEAAAILGVSSFDTPQGIFLAKTGKGKEFKGNQATELGTFFEPCIADYYQQKTGRTVWADGSSFRHPQYAFIGCHIDRIQAEVGVPAGENDGIVEIKMTSKVEMRDSYVLQLQHNMLVTGKSWGTVVVLGGTKYIHKDFEADLDLHRAMVAIYSKFWEAVEANNWEVFCNAI